MPTSTDALQLLEHGWSVIPVNQQKRPLIRWTPYMTTTPSISDVRYWWRRWPNANVGIITGNLSRLIVVDIDFKIDEDLMPPTLYVVTGRGYHLYYRPPLNMEFPVRNAVNVWSPVLFAKVDIRGEGGYVVAPPSIHENGTYYQFVHWTTGPGSFEDFNRLLGREVGVTL